MTAARAPVLAGTWYPAQAERLRNEVLTFLAGARQALMPPGKPVIALAPHAGYQYCGPTAGKLYGTLSGHNFLAVFILAPCHRTPLRRPALSGMDAFSTPLGEVPIAKGIVQTLAANDVFEINDRAHAFEHAVEIQLPFLQCALAPCTPIVPILVPRLDRAMRRLIARALDPWRDGRCLFLVSSDLTHYGDAYAYVPFTENVAERIEQLDRGAIDRILNRDPEGLVAYEQRTGITMCGLEAAAVAMDDPSLDHFQSALLAYERSADLTGDQNLSVSYAAAVICADMRADALVGERALSGDERAFLTSLARTEISAAVRGDQPVETTKLAEEAGLSLAGRLLEQRAAFVTLTLDNDLRGCIGSLEATKSLVNAVADSARSAALKDPRFNPVTAAELEKLQIEISVLTPLRPVDGPGDIMIGRHGILLAKSRRQAVFLPQVPIEQGWDLDTTLDHLCLKAGLHKSDWRRDCTFKVFEAEIFHE